MSCIQLLKTVAYPELLRYNTSPGSYNQDVFLFDWQELLLGIKAHYYLSCLCQIEIDWCHLLSETARSEYTLPRVLWACCWHWLLSVYRGSLSRFMSVIDYQVKWKHATTRIQSCPPAAVCTHVWHPYKAVLCTCGSSCMLTCAMWNDFQYSAPHWWLIASFILHSCTSPPLLTFPPTTPLMHFLPSSSSSEPPAFREVSLLAGVILSNSSSQWGAH